MRALTRLKARVAPTVLGHLFLQLPDLYLNKATTQGFAELRFPFLHGVAANSEQESVYRSWLCRKKRLSQARARR